MWDWPIALTVGGMLGASIATAVGVGFSIAKTIFGLKLSFTKDMHALQLAFTKDLSETRHGLYGRLDMQHNLLTEQHDDLEKRVRATEIAVGKVLPSH